MTTRIRVMCVDDHPTILEGLSAMIGRQPDMDLVAIATSGERAIEQYDTYRPDVTLMDLRLPTMSGLEAIMAIRHRDPQARIIVLTMFNGDEDIYRALKAGAATYVLKDIRGDELLQIMREVHAGARLPLTLSSLMAARETQGGLTARELEVLELMARGRRNKEIGAELGISVATTKVHVKNVLAKLKVNDRTAAVSVGLQRGIIHL
jgi:DNA-binding NarL/FixJ family response regulator